MVHGPVVTPCHHGQVHAPWTTGPLLGFDLETTGVDRYDDVPVSFAFVPYDGGQRRGGTTTIVNPRRPIPEGAMAVHGITDERAAAEGMALDDAIGEVVARLVEASKAHVAVVGCNLAYDLTMVNAAAERELGIGLVEAGFSAPVLDALVLDRHFDKWRKGKRKLDVMCEVYGVTLDGAHEASVDAAASVEVVLKMAEKFPKLAEMDLDELHLGQAGWHRDWAVDFSEWLKGKGKPGLEDDELLWPIATR